MRRSYWPQLLQALPRRRVRPTNLSLWVRLEPCPSPAIKPVCDQVFVRSTPPIAAQHSTGYTCRAAQAPAGADQRRPAFQLLDDKGNIPATAEQHYGRESCVSARAVPGKCSMFFGVDEHFEPDDGGPDHHIIYGDIQARCRCRAI